jgi:hypothetical protein
MDNILILLKFVVWDLGSHSGDNKNYDFVGWDGMCIGRYQGFGGLCCLRLFGRHFSILKFAGSSEMLLDV